jgi:hypothetical protein
VFLPAVMSDPFGEQPTPWWQRIWRRDGRESAPRRYAGPAGAVGPLAGWLLTDTHGMDPPSKVAFLLALFVAPPALVEMWWRRRRSRADAQLQLLPADPPS